MNPYSVEQIAKYHKKISDPKEFGPIVWNGMHKEAITCKTKKEAEDFIFERIQKILDFYVNCEKCHKDGTAWHIENKYRFRYKDEKSAFFYTCDFHNYVNKKTGKPSMERLTAYDLYTGIDMQMCSLDCAAGDDKEKKPITSNGLRAPVPRRININ